MFRAFTAFACSLRPACGMEFQGFPRIHSIFYAVFDIVKGAVVKHQVPEGSVTPIARTATHAAVKPLIDFEPISEYIIPKEQLFKRLVTICVGNYKVMGCPVGINNHEKYSNNFRNEFRFNLCFVFARDAEISSYEAVVRKLARVFEVLEVIYLTSLYIVCGAMLRLISVRLNATSSLWTQNLKAELCKMSLNSFLKISTVIVNARYLSVRRLFLILQLEYKNLNRGCSLLQTPPTQLTSSYFLLIPIHQKFMTIKYQFA